MASAECKAQVRCFLADWMHQLRLRRSLTQEEMSGFLALSPRGYRKLEAENCNLSATTLLFLLVMMTPYEREWFLAQTANVLQYDGKRRQPGANL